MQAVQDAEPVQNDIFWHTIPVMPTEESQAYKGIDHPLVSCRECSAVWRSHGRSLCPMMCAQEGYPMSLTSRQYSNLERAMSKLPYKVCYTDEQMDLQVRRFSNLLREKAPWYDINSLQTIQACYEYVSVRMAAHLAADVAIALFKEDYEYKMRAADVAIALFKEDYEYKMRWA